MESIIRKDFARPIIIVYCIMYLQCFSLISQSYEIQPHDNKSTDQYSIDLQIRPRAEYREGYKMPSKENEIPVFLTTQRSRLGLKYSSNYFISKFSVQDVRTWGEQKVKSDKPAIDAHEAWIELFVSDKFAIKLGRQELAYDDQRLFARTNWNQRASSHDLLLLKYLDKNTSFHLGLAYNNDSEKLFESGYTVDLYKTLHFIHASKLFSKGIRLSVMGIGDGHLKENTKNTIYVRNTLGFNIEFENEKHVLVPRGSFFIQKGQDKRGHKINAHFLSSSVSYKLTDKIIPGLGIDYFSGTNALDTLNMVNHSFSNLYGAGYKFLGIMNYFTRIDKHTNGGGLIDLYGIISFRFNKKIKGKLAIHNFSLANNVIDTRYDSQDLMAVPNYLGSELDVTLKYSFRQFSTLAMGYAVMINTESMNVIKGGEHHGLNNWAYIMINVHPELKGKIRP